MLLISLGVFPAELQAACACLARISRWVETTIIAARRGSGQTTEP